ncbi:helix-turn-helix transcriptional regulator [Rhizobium leguminosarum]|uniref:helix-turn-helix transcriptional regulator n=1 Tax=Rhizobium leguminosarum TaxID=384 RepID=UPI001C95AF29|nr:helix-turn-helix transcriptional regulator [Rhizobium leguminosarum]MBY5775263.1 helix-turn-helix transcriptional regulator [Rhizobium leguminosarum]
MNRNSFLADIRAAADHEALARVIADVAAAFGFDEFAYASWPSNWRNDRRPDTIISCGHLPIPFNECLTASACDGFIVQVMDTIRPVVWNDETDRQVSRLTEEFVQQGVKEVWAKSERDSHNNRGLLCFLRFRSLPDRPEAKDENGLAWMSYIIHLHGGEFFSRKRLANLSTVLSERECEVLRWTGDGKTSEEISYILAISKNTVNFHVKNAALKLGCVNKTAAVVTAMRLGLL